MEKFNYSSESEQNTIDYGFQFAKILKPGDVVAFYGDLGTGKTEFIKGICRFFDVSDIVTSPTFTMINHYVGTLNSKDLDIYHLDLYRIKSQEELKNIGFSECVFDENSIKLIEWAERADSFLKKNATYSVHITQFDDDENRRRIEIDESN